MRKKKIIALLLGTTIIAGIATSFAYFTNKSNNITDADGKALQKIQITNGQVQVLAQATSEGENSLDWSYDVARYSEMPAGVKVTDADYEAKNASPDINATEKETVNGLSRAKIGSPLPAEIKYTRPGDAIVLGTKNKEGKIGLEIKNNSNLTIKAQLNVLNDAAAKAEVKKLTDAGWELYVEGKKVDLAAGIKIDLAAIAGKQSQLVDVRLELPLGTGNTYQNKAAGTNVEDGFDISKIFEIRATQENNPGWNEDGSGVDGTGTVTNPIQP
ncbi:hypothetical protein CM240_0128 [Clostridium bornimense]|uniref:Uncharacterized protein n=1 Tax=Clostridium bornimense TaxID=1216932 RepID=W6RZ40_9CLOT|nr:hypothetical protein [Clostridium bornimense]CDM67307.1 hypothetical protein CM240_0128 [Clostridium bornimense]